MAEFDDLLLRILAVQDRQIAGWHEITLKAHAMVAELSVERGRLEALLSGTAPKSEPVLMATSAAAPSPPRLRSRAAQAIVDALADAGTAGLSGTEVNEAVMAAGMQRDASEKAKAALKRAGHVVHDYAAQRWYAPHLAPAHLPAPTPQPGPLGIGRRRPKTKEKSG